jgi:hypothetical protein
MWPSVALEHRQFAGEPSDLRLLLSRRRIGPWHSLRRISAFRLWRLGPSSFDRFAACFGAPFHRDPLAEGHRSAFRTRAGSGLFLFV